MCEDPEKMRRLRGEMDAVDRLHPAVRKIVHDVGWKTVKSLMAAGIYDALEIREAVNELRGRR